jgi:gliding motility-associated lipoprotein GldH
MNGLKYYISILLSGVLFASCNSSVVFEENVKIPDYSWDMSNIVSLDVEISDTITSNNIYINIRNASGYPFSNLFLFLTTKTPSGQIARDTVELILADESGQWLGDGLGDIWDNRILFKPAFRFPQKGTYRFEFQQAMRMNPLPQIMDVGLRIERVEH